MRRETRTRYPNNCSLLSPVGRVILRPHLLSFFSLENLYYSYRSDEFARKLSPVDAVDDSVVVDFQRGPTVSRRPTELSQLFSFPFGTTSIALNMFLMLEGMEGGGSDSLTGFEHCLYIHELRTSYPVRPCFSSAGPRRKVDARLPNRIFEGNASGAGQRFQGDPFRHAE